MDWFKKHKLWTLVIAYFAIAMVVGCIGSAIGVLDALGVGRVAGIIFLPYFYVCWQALKQSKKEGTNHKSQGDDK